MVQMGAVSCLLLLATSVFASAGHGELGGHNKMGRDMIGGRDIRGHIDPRRDGPGSIRKLAAQINIQEGLSPSTPTNITPARADTTSLIYEPQIPPSAKIAEAKNMKKRQDSNDEGTVEALAGLPAPVKPAQTTLGPIGSSVSASLASSAASALASASAGFQDQLGALSSQSSADIAAASAAASAAVSASASAAIASITGSAASEIASASSAVDAANAVTSMLVASASSAGSAAASSSADASAMSAVAAVKASLASEISEATPSATASIINNVVQPNSSGSLDEAGAVLVTPSQIAAIVIGTVVGTAIFTLLVVYAITICRHRKERKFLERYQRENKYSEDIVLNAVDHNDETGRAEGYSSRDEKQRADWSAQTTQMAIPQKAQLTSQRPRLPPLPEESPRVSDQSNLYPPGEGSLSRFDFHAMSYTPEETTRGIPAEEPEPVKLTLMKRQSKGGSQRLAVTRVGGVGRQSSGNSTDNPRTSVVNPYFSGPLTPGSPPFQRPALVRTPSSDTLPHTNSKLPSPLGLNPSLGASAVPRSSAYTWAPPPSDLYQNLNVQVQPDYQDHVRILLQPSNPSPRPVQQADYYVRRSDSNNSGKGAAAMMTAAGSGTRTIENGYLSPKPLNPKNHLSISPTSPYSSTFENPLASPSYMSPLSPPPKSPLRGIVRHSQSEYSLRERSVSPLSSDGEDGTERATPPLPLRRFSRSSGELGAVGLAQATAGLDLDIGPSGGRAIMPRRANTNSTVAGGGSSGSPRSTGTNTNPDGGGRFTFLASNGHTPESSRSLTPTNPWGPLPALTKRRSSSLGRIEIPPEQLTAGGIYVGAPGPKFTLFPRTDEAGGGSTVGFGPVNPLGLTHGKSRSTGYVEYRRENGFRAGLGVVNNESRPSSNVGR